MDNNSHAGFEDELVISFEGSNILGSEGSLQSRLKRCFIEHVFFYCSRDNVLVLPFALTGLLQCHVEV